MGREINELAELLNNRIALKQEQIDDLEIIPRSRLHQETFWSIEKYRDGYNKQNKLLKSIAEKHNLGYVNSTKIIDSLHNVPIFFDAVHLTKQANEILAEKIQNYLSNVLNDD